MKKMIIVISAGVLVCTAIILLLVRFGGDRSPPKERNGNHQTEDDSDKFTDQTSSHSRFREEIRRRDKGLPRADGVASIADVDLPLFFEDDSLTDSVRNEIELDLERLNIARDSHTIYLKEASDSVIHFSGGDIEVPDLFYNELNAVRKIDGTDQLLVSTALSDAYVKAIEFREQHRKEYDALIATIDRIDRNRPEDVTEDNADEILSTEIKFKVSNEQKASQRREAVSSISSLNFLHPSVLEFRLEEFDGQQNLVAYLHAPAPGADTYVTIGFVWRDERWSAVLGPPGT